MGANRGSKHFFSSPPSCINRMVSVSEALFYTGCDTPFQGPSLGRPILGASNHGYFSLLALYVDFLVAGVRKTQEDTLKVFILSKYSACKTINTRGK